jgi:hypothetical protein
MSDVPQPGRGRGTRGRGRGAGAASATSAATAGGGGAAPETNGPTPDAAAGAGADEAVTSGVPARVPPAERRAAALGLVSIWRDVARDLALVALGQPGEVRELDLLDDLEAVAARVPRDFGVRQLRSLELAGERLEGNVSPELVVDALALGWTA